MLVGGLDFKSMYSNQLGIWVRLREINYLIEKGIIQIDREALHEYANTPDPEYCALMEKNSPEDGLRDLLGRELDDSDRLLVETVRNAIVGKR